MSKRIPKFLRDCHAAAALIDEEIDESLTWAAESRRTSVYEDDGALHVEKGGLHVAFDIGQDQSLREQNERMTKVLTHLKLLKFSDKALHSDYDIACEEREECPQCDRSCNC